MSGPSARGACWRPSATALTTRQANAAICRAARIPCGSVSWKSTNPATVFLFFRGGGIAAAARGPWGRGLLGVVSDVPSGAFELDGRSGDHLLDLAAALGALLHHFGGVQLDFFEAVTALFAFVFVKWHECETAVRNNCVKLILGAAVRRRQF